MLLSREMYVLHIFSGKSRVISNGAVQSHAYPLQAVSAPEEAPAESAPEKPSDAGEASVSEDVADAGGGGGSSGKKEAACSRAVPDGALVKGTPPSLPRVPVSTWHLTGVTSD